MFIRYCEDHQLLGDTVYLASPDLARMTVAEESHEEYFHRLPSRTDRDWLDGAFAEIAQSPGRPVAVRPDHNPLYQLPISHDAAKALIGVLAPPRRGRHAGARLHRPDWDTRFLGDLYQDLSEQRARRYALLQTPEFVEEFILDRTLDPALDEFGLDAVAVIDPTCGSGHFLLGAFHRLLDDWRAAGARAATTGTLVQRRARRGARRRPQPVRGGDRPVPLLVAALQACGVTTLDDARLRLDVAVGDSLLHRRRADQAPPRRRCFGDD